jgi:hypothetical protein
MVSGLGAGSNLTTGHALIACLGRADGTKDKEK